MKSLTPRKQEIAALVAMGRTNKEIARELRLAEGTVKIHLHAIYRQLGLRNRTQLACLQAIFAWAIMA